jgi:hypothetical protein
VCTALLKEVCYCSILPGVACESLNMQVLFIVWNDVYHHFDVCAITSVGHIEIIDSQNFESSCLCSTDFIIIYSLLLLESVSKSVKSIYNILYLKKKNYRLLIFAMFILHRCPQFCLDSLDDYEDAICLNIEGVLKKEKSQV